MDLGETHLEASAGLSRTMLEERYNNESDLMDAVAQGDIEKAMKIVERHRRFRYSDDRFFNDLQELRNSLIVLNVLLRKSIQRRRSTPVISIPYLPGTISASARSQSSRSRRCGKRCLWAIAAVCRSMRCAIIRP